MGILQSQVSLYRLALVSCLQYLSVDCIEVGESRLSGFLSLEALCLGYSFSVVIFINSIDSNSNIYCPFFYMFN